MFDTEPDYEKQEMEMEAKEQSSIERGERELEEYLLRKKSLINKWIQAEFLETMSGKVEWFDKYKVDDLIKMAKENSNNEMALDIEDDWRKYFQREKV